MTYSAEAQNAVTTLAFYANFVAKKYYARVPNSTVLYSKEPISAQMKSKTCSWSSATVTSNRNYTRVHVSQWVVNSLMRLFTRRKLIAGRMVSLKESKDETQVIERLQKHKKRIRSLLNEENKIQADERGPWNREAMTSVPVQDDSHA